MITQMCFLEAAVGEMYTPEQSTALVIFGLLVE